MDNFQINFSPDLLFPQNETPFTQIPNNISSDFGQYPRPQQPFADVAEFQQGSESSVGPARSRKISRDARNEKKIMAEQNRRDATRSNTNVLRNKLPRSYERDATSDPKVLEKVILYIDYLEAELGLTKEKKDELPPPPKNQQSSSVDTSGRMSVPQSD